MPTPSAPTLDAVVLPAQNLPRLLGVAPAKLAAFAYRNKAWHRILLQVDERVAMSFKDLLESNQRNNPKSLFYADPTARVGADPNPKLDADDEVVVLASQAGARAPAANPAGSLPATRTRLTLPGRVPKKSAIYLFAMQAAKPLPARMAKTRYEFRLKNGKTYEDGYNEARGPNPENSTITTPNYRLHFSDRWSLDNLRITTPGAPGSDILDHHKVQVIPGNCIRTTKTFEMGRGSILANIRGPIRAIRSVIGANSGPLTERLWICYPQAFVIRTHLRVHAIPSVLMFFDYNENAIGMRYHDNHNPKGLLVDGKPDPLKKGKLLWQFLSGTPGSLAIHYDLDTTIAGLMQSSLGFDDTAPKWSQCTGDTKAIGVVGPYVQRLSNTDPRLGRCKRLTSTVTVIPGPPNAPCQAPRAAPRAPAVTVR